MDFFKTYYERIGRQMHLLKNAKSITAREITEKELGADPAAATTSRLSWT